MDFYLELIDYNRLERPDLKSLGVQYDQLGLIEKKCIMKLKLYFPKPCSTPMNTCKKLPKISPNIIARLVAVFNTI